MIDFNKLYCTDCIYAKRTINLYNIYCAKYKIIKAKQDSCKDYTNKYEQQL